jgi:Ca-activated chloride channel family protein
MNLDLLSALHWARPQLLWALCVLPLIALWAWRRGRDAGRWQHAVDPHLLPHLLQASGKGARRWPWTLLLGWTLAVLALAGPGWKQQAQPLLQPQSPLVVVLDLSTRITATDLPPSRLLQARAKLGSLLQQREGGQLALVVYADDAYTVAPLTDDVANIALYLDALSPQVMPVDGQRTDRALDWATRLLQRSGMRAGQVLLLTDSADAAAIDAARQAHGQGVQVSVIGLGTTTGAAYRDTRGQISNAALDEASLRRLADAGGGRYQRLARDTADLRALDLLRADRSVGESEQGSVRQWLDQGYWLLPPLMLLALLAFRRRSAVLSVLLLIGAAGLQPTPVLAQAGASAAPQAAPQAGARSGLWLRDDQRRQQQLEQGVQAYHAGDFSTAARTFEGVQTAEGWYNLGNARARQGDLDGAVQAYDHALSRRPGMPDAVANRAVVDAARKRRPPPSPKDGKSPPSQGGNSKPPPQGQGQAQPPASGQPSSTGKGAPKPGEPGQPPPAGAPSDKPAQGEAARQPPVDPQAQARADAEQRQRMQQAVQQGNEGKDGKDGKDGKQPARRSDGRTPQQREQQQAVEAWMRRVPDRPGDLLRAKFQLENERRKQEGP